MVKLGTLAFQVNADSIGSVQLPPSHLLREEIVGGSSVITVNTRELHEFIEESLHKSVEASAQEHEVNENANENKETSNGSDTHGT